MSLRHALLIALQEQQGTGYEITKKFEQGMGYFWQSSHQQIYQELAKLAKQGWVKYDAVEQQSKPSKKVYAITKTGRTELIHWLSKPTAESPFKDPLLMKLYAGYLVPTQVLLDEMLRQQQGHRELLQTYHVIEDKHFIPCDELSEPMQYVYLTLVNGIRMLEAWLSWADEVIEFLRVKL